MRESVGNLVVGVEFAPNFVAQVIGEDYGFSEYEGCLPDNGGRFSPGVACREHAESDAWNDLGCGRRLCEPRPFPELFCMVAYCIQLDCKRRSEISRYYKEIKDLGMCGE